MSKIKNILIFVAIGAGLILLYVFFIKGDPEEENLVSSSDSTISTEAGGEGEQTLSIGQDFLSLLLNVKNIKLNDTIFSDPAFISLKDSSITLIQDGNEGRPNPFAPIGSDAVEIPQTSTVSFPEMPTEGVPAN